MFSRSSASAPSPAPPDVSTMSAEAQEAVIAQRKRDIAARYLKLGFSEGEVLLRQGLAVGGLKLKQAAGLGHTPNVVPVTRPLTNVALRDVRIGWHPVAGAVGAWFSNDTFLGKAITGKINSYPDPTQHWAVLVGDYAHQLWMDENFDVIYTNQQVAVEEWKSFPVANTRFNDDAIRRTGEMVIQHTREKQAAYNLISNNCQTYALRLLDAIQASGTHAFPTTLDVYNRLLTGPGKVMELFSPEDGPGTPTGPDDAVAAAEQVMLNNTTQVPAGVPPPVEAVMQGPGRITDAQQRQAVVADVPLDPALQAAMSGQDPNVDSKGGKQKKRTLLSRIPFVGS